MDRKFHCALFDVDGTLVDSRESHALAWQKAFADFGYDFPIKKMMQDIGMGGSEIVENHLGKKDAGEIGRKIADRQFNYFKDEYIANVQPFPCAKKLLGSLAERGVNIILASSALKTVVEYFIEMLEIGNEIVGYITANDVKRTEPAPDIFEAATRNCCPHIERITVIGDSPYDIEAAHIAGLYIIALRNEGFTKDQLSDADRIFDSVRELYEKIDDVFSFGKMECPRK